MAKQPYIPLYTGDYIKDTRKLPLSVRGAWMDLILFMWNEPIKGEITETIEGFSRLLSCTSDEAKFALNLLIEKDVCDHEKIGSDKIKIISRRIKKDIELSAKRKMSGSSGGKNSRNTPSKKLYNLPGYIYIISDLDSLSEFKIGISKDPQKRIYGIRRDTGRQNLKVVWKEFVKDMGAAEDYVLQDVKTFLDGEWGIFKSESYVIEIVSKSLSKFKAKHKQNTDIEYENDIEYEINSFEGAGNFYFDSKTILPVFALEAAEMNQFTHTKNKNTDFVKSQWMIFLKERMNDPPEKKRMYRQIQDLTTYFLNWNRNKFPKNGTHQRNNSENGNNKETIATTGGFGKL